MIININNRFTKINQIKVSIRDNGFQYGEGVFETIRTYEKAPFLLEKHLRRLFKSAEALDIKINYKKEEIIKIVGKVIEKSSSKKQKIKIIAKKNLLLITSQKLTSPKGVEKGVKCKSIHAVRSMPKIKSTAYLDSYIPHQKAQKEGYYDALLVDDNENVTEGAYSNIFWFEKETLCTTKKNILEGITREAIIKLSPFPVAYKEIKLHNLKRKTEVFLTQTTTGIVPIKQIDGTKINDGKIGPKTKVLIKAFNDYVASQSNRQPR